MSVKVYEAYRTPVKKLAEGVAFLDGYIRPKAQLALDGFLDSLSEEAVRAENTYLGDRPVSPMARVLYFQALRYKNKELADDARQFLQCGFTVWLRGNWAYYYPWVSFRMNLQGDYLDTGVRPAEWPDWWEEFCYYNNSDEPAIYTRRQWKKRAKAWEFLDTDEIQTSKLVHNILVLDDWDSLAPLCASYEKRRSRAYAN